MLIDYQVTNYKSIRDEQQLSMLPSRRGGDFEALPIVAIYGANAGGKSNFIESIRNLKQIGSPDFKLGNFEPHRPFLLDDTSRKQPTSYKLEAVIEGDRYSYGLTADEVAIRTEYLYLTAESTGRRRTLFERVGTDINFGATVKNKSSLGLWAEELALNAPTLTLAVGHRAEELQPFRRWLQRDLLWMLAGPAGRNETLTNAFKRQPILEDLVHVADLGISAIRVEEATGPNPSYIDELMDQARELELQADAIPELEEAERVYRRYESLKRHIDLLIEPKLELKFYHNGYRRPFNIDQESKGTKTFLTYMTQILTVLERGATLIVDEFDTSLHSRLIPRIIELFQDKQTNPHNAQLIFSTHDASLLGTSFGERILSRDEVWFIEKDSEGSTEVFPLSSFKSDARIEHNWERAYVGGSYGAIPQVYADSLVDVLKAAERNPQIEQGDSPG
jgi:uncharacterized protein